MKVHRLVVFILLFLVCISAVDATQRSFNVKVHKINAENEPISGATVTLQRQDTGASYDLSPTNVSGYSTTRTLDINVQNPPSFTVTASAQGYNSVTLQNLQFQEAILQTSKTFIVQLTQQPTTPPPTPTPQATPESGIIKNVQLVSTENCPTGFVQKGEISDAIFSENYKFCVEYTRRENFTVGELYVNLTYFQLHSGENYCTLGGTSAGFVATPEGNIDFCVSKNNIASLADSQYAYDAKITLSQSDCVGFNVINGPFIDDSQQQKYFCAAIWNYVTETDQACEITEPQWIKNDFSQIESATGTDATDEKTLPGDQEIYLSVNAPIACRTKNIMFELYEGTGTDPAAWTKKASFTSLSWRDNKMYIQWPPVWFKETGPGATPTTPRLYRFKAKIQGTTSETEYSNDLTVNPPKPRECEPAGANNQCGAGKVCQFPGVCVSQCTTNSDCTQGFCNTATGACVQCTQNAQCIQSTEFGADYICDLKAESPTLNHCIYNGKCTLTNLRWSGVSGNQLATTQTEIHGNIAGTEYQCGDKIALIADQVGCEGKTITFKVYEKNNLFSGQGAPLQAQIFGNIAHYSGWSPPWDVPSFLESILGGGNSITYYFTAAIKEDPSQKIAGTSAELVVTKPLIKQCTYNAQSEEDECEDGFICNECRQCQKQCKVNSDCETGVCNPQGRCVECLTNERCARVSPNTPLCDMNASKCVECLKPEDCAENAQEKNCFKNECTKKCAPQTESTDCKEAGKTKCDALNQVCVECVEDSNCANTEGKTKCEKDTNLCVQCEIDADCGFMGTCTNDVCEGGGGFESFLPVIIGALLGMVTMGPMGAIMGALGGLLMGGGGSGLGGLFGGLF